MKFVRRAAPGGRPAADRRAAAEVVFAAILDGRTLWLAVRATHGSLALRPTAGGDVVDLPLEPRDDQPGLRSTRFALGGLPGSPGLDDTAYDVVLDGVPVRCAPLDRPAARPAEAVTHVLHRTADATLQVRRSSQAPTVTLRKVWTDPDGLHLGVDAPRSATALALLADDGSVLTSCSLNGVTGTITGTITGATLAGLAPQATRVVVGEPGAWTAVGRRANHLAEPGRGVPLPELDGDGDGAPRLRLRWSGQALLMARLVDGPDGPDGSGGDS